MKIYSTMFATCPYCGNVNRYIVTDDAEEYRIYIYYCDIETGGCNKPFAITLKIEFKPIVYELQEVKNEMPTMQ